MATKLAKKKPVAEPVKKPAALPVKRTLTPASRTSLKGPNATPPPVHHDDTEPTSQLATTSRSSAPSNGDVEGEINRSDLTTPSLKIVQSIGPLSENFDGGVIVLNGEIPITDEPDKDNPTPLEITVLRIKKEYEENIEYGDEKRARVFSTECEVIEAGGHCEWVNNKKPPFSPIATILVVVKAPETSDETILANFPHQFEAENKANKALNGSYALALYKTKGSSYTRAAKLVFNAVAMSDLKNRGLSAGAWVIGAKREKVNGNFVFVPVMKRTGTHPDEFIEFLKYLTA